MMGTLAAGLACNNIPTFGEPLRAAVGGDIEDGGGGLRITRIRGRAGVRLLPHKGAPPRLHPSVFVAQGARIVGDVEIGEDSSVWFNTVIRGDIAPVRIGRRTNVQDGCVLPGR